jgi:asparagine synthetase B (glutamine-hydrolysing)
MLTPLVYHPRQAAASWTAPGRGFGLVERGEGFGFQQAGMAQRDGVIVLIDGEVFPDESEVPADLRGDSPTIQRADYCLGRYLENGISFVENLNGVFGIAILDGRNQQVHLANDRFGHRLLFFWHNDDEFAFSSSLRSILALGNGIGGRYDSRAVAELVVFERLLADRTLYRDIKRLPAGSRATWNGRRWEVVRYFTPRRRPISPRLGCWRDGADELARRLKRSLGKRMADGAATGLFLSGGLDSRLVLGCAPGPLTALTFSHPGMLAREAGVAARLAAAANVRLILLERDQDYYATIARRGAELNEGLATFVGAHSIGTHGVMYDEGIRVAITGDRSDVAFKDYFASCIDRQGLDPWTGSAEQVRKAARRLMHSGMIRKADHQDLMLVGLTEELQAEFAALYGETEAWLRDLLAEGDSLDETLSEMALCDWQAQTALGMIRGLSTEFVERSPFFDNDVWNLAMELPIAWRADAQIVKKAIVSAAPKLGRIEDVSTRIPPCLPTEVAVIGERVKGVAKSCRRALRRLSRNPGGTSEPAVFSSSGFHDLNAALRQSNAYRRLVEESVAALPEAFFDRDAIQAILNRDLNATQPGAAKLFEILITFAEFSKNWGDHGCRLENTPAAVPAEVPASAGHPRLLAV